MHRRLLAMILGLRLRLLPAVFALAVTMTFLTSVATQERTYGQVVAEIRDEGFNRSQVIDYAWYLADVIGPRVSGRGPRRRKGDGGRPSGRRVALRAGGGSSSSSSSSFSSSSLERRS